MKLATADESKGLGTGKNDYSLHVDVVRNAEGLAVRDRGLLVRRPAGIELRVRGSAPWDRMARRLGHQPGAAYDYRQRTVEGGAKVSELMVFFAQPLERGGRRSSISSAASPTRVRMRAWAFAAYSF